MDKKIFDQENQHLEETLVKLKDAQKHVESSMEVMGAENLQKLKELRETPETQMLDFHMFMERMHEQNVAFNFKDKYQRVEELKSLLNEPYFSRLCLTDKTRKELDDIYIGKFGYTEKNKSLITDWRAKIASVYYRYRYPQKNVKYDTPDGTEVRDLTLKRTFEIDKGTLIKYYNNDIQLDESEIIAEKIGKRTGGVLEDIVETIQTSQLDIIESDPRQICIVQGCVGSGKSTVAIHKLSHIFFNFATLIHPERAILIAKNQILVGYLSTLFPKLGIFDINYKTLRDVIINLVFREEMPITVDLDSHLDTSNFTLSDIKKVEKLLANVHEDYAQKLKELFEKPEFVTFGGFIYNSKVPVMENLREAIDDMEEELQMQEEALHANPNSIKAWLFKDNIKSLKKLVHQLKKIKENLKNEALPKIISDLKIKAGEKLGYLETLIYIFVYAELIGLTKWIKFEYCVVDEGQDFSTLEYLVLGKVVMNGRFCILGDLNQSYKNDGLASWEEISQVVQEAKKANVFELETNYRSTKPIIDLANKILNPYTKDYLPKSINRIGHEPKIHKLPTFNDVIKTFTAELEADLKQLDKSIGIICFTEKTMEHVEKVLKDLNVPADVFIKLDEKKPISYIPRGVYLSMFENCKGLEFAKVYVLDLNLDKIDNFTEAKKAFVSVTRAMNELSVYSVK